MSKNQAEKITTDSKAENSSRRKNEDLLGKFQLVGTGASHKAGGLKPSLHGAIYQINLTMLFMHRALKKEYLFDIGSEVLEADSFDDIVFKYEKPGANYRFIQAKHKQSINNKIAIEHLTNTTDGEFSVLKYYQSYCNMKITEPSILKGNFQDFILCTNIDIHHSLEEAFNEIIDDDPFFTFTLRPRRLKLIKGTTLYNKLRDLLLNDQTYDPDFPFIQNEQNLDNSHPRDATKYELKEYQKLTNYQSDEKSEVNENNANTNSSGNEVNMFLEAFIFAVHQSSKVEFNKSQIKIQVEKGENMNVVDSVFKYQQNGTFKYRLFQTKNKLTNSEKIYESDITNSGSDYSIIKYYRAYRQIKITTRNFLKGAFQDFTLCTNIDMHSNLDIFFNEITDRDPILNFSVRPRRLVIKKNTILYKKLADILLGATDYNPNYPKIAKKLGAYAVNDHNVIQMEKIFLDNKQWMMRHIFEDSSTPKTKKMKVKFRKDFLYPVSTDIAELNKIFIQAYFDKRNEMHSEKAELTDVPTNTIRETLSDKLFEVGGNFARKEGEDKNIVLPPSEVDVFLEKLTFAVSQPGEKDLANIVEKEIGEYMKLVDSRLVVSTLQSYILDWAKSRDGIFVKHQDCIEMFKAIEDQLAIVRQTSLTQTYKASIDKYTCLFNENETVTKLNTFLKKENDAKVLILYYANRLLTDIKVMQLKQDAKLDEYIYIEMHVFLDIVDTIMCPLKIFGAVGSIELFLAFNDMSFINNNLKYLMRRIFKILMTKQDKKLVLIVPCKLKPNINTILEEISNFELPFVEVEDIKNDFKDLTLDSQKRVLKNGIVKLQGCEVSLEKLADDDLKCSLTGDFLAEVICQNFSINIDYNNDDYEEIRDFYIERNLYRRVLISGDFKSDDHFVVIQDNYYSVIQDKEVVIISNCEVDFDKACNYYENINIHWLKKDSDAFVWQKSRGSIVEIRKYEYEINDKKNDVIDKFTDELSLFGPVDLGDSQILKQKVKKMVFEDPFFRSPFGKSKKKEVTNRHKDDIIIKCVSDLSDRIVIISADAGMGKSSLLSHCAEHNVSMTNPSEYYVIKTNLKDYCNEFYEMPKETFNIKDAVIFLYRFSKLEHVSNNYVKSIGNVFIISDTGELCLQTDTKKSKLNWTRLKLFTHLYNNSKIVVLFDGFDEIAPDYKDKVLNLLVTLKSSRLHKMWITTRPYNIQDELENRLHEFSFNLRPVAEDEQILMIRSIWEKRLDISIETEDLNFFLSKYISHDFWQLDISKIYNQYLFFGSPQHIMMIAVIYEELFLQFYCCHDEPQDQTEVEDNDIKILTINDLYTKFFEIKFKNSIKLDRKIPALRPVYEKMLREKFIDHCKLGLMELFAIDDLPRELISENEWIKLLEDVTSATEKTGLVTRILCNRPRFIHRTYAEYFAANALAEALQLKTKEHDKYIATKNFLYQLLINNTIPASVMTHLNYKIVSTSEKVEIFNAAITYDKSKLLPIIDKNHIRDSLGRTPLHLLCCSQIICNVRMKRHNINIDDLKYYFEEDELFRWTPLHYSIACHDCQRINLAFNDDLSINEKKDLADERGMTPYMLAVRRGCNHECIKTFLKEIPLNLDVKDDDENTALHYALARNDRSGLLCAKMLIYMGANLFLADRYGNTPLNIIITQRKEELIYTVVEFLYENNKQQFKQFCIENIVNNNDFCAKSLSRELKLTTILLEIDSIDVNVHDKNGKTPLHLAYENIEIDGTDTLLCLIKHKADVNAIDNEGRLPSYFNHEEMLKILSKGYSPKKFSYLNEMAGKDYEAMESFIMTMKFENDIAVHILSRYQNISIALLSHNIELLNIKDSQGKTALHYAIMFKRLRNVAFLLNKGIHKNTKDKDDKTPLGYLTKNGDDPSRSERIFYYMVMYGACYDVPSDFAENNELIRSLNNLFVAVQSNNVEDIETILHNANDVQFLVNASSNNHGGRPIHCAVQNEHEGIFKLLISKGAFCNVRSSSKDINKLIILVSKLFGSIKDGDVDEVLNCIKQEDIVNAGYNSGNVFFHPLHSAVFTNHAGIVELLLSHGADVKAKAINDDTILHIGCKENRKEVMEVILKYISKENLQTLFLHRNMDDLTALDIAVLNTNNDVDTVFLLLNGISTSDNPGVLDVIHRARNLAKVMNEIMFHVLCNFSYNLNDASTLCSNDMLLFDA